MNILILGRGAIGAQYGWALEKEGHSVEFLIRPGSTTKYGDFIDIDHLDARQDLNGTLIREHWPIRTTEAVTAGHNYDVIMVSVNHPQVEGAVATVAPIVGDATVLMFSNIWDTLETVAAPLPTSQVIWGFPGGGGGFVGQTLISGFLSQIILETESSSVSQERHRKIVDLFEGAGFSMNYQDNMQAWYWDHIILNAVMHGSTLKAGGYDNLYQSMDELTELVLLMKELLPIIPAKGEEYPASSIMMLETPAELIAG